MLFLWQRLIGIGIYLLQIATLYYSDLMQSTEFSSFSAKSNQHLMRRKFCPWHHPQLIGSVGPQERDKSLHSDSPNYVDDFWLETGKKMENHVQVPKSSEDVSSLSGRLVLFRTIICCMDTGQTYEPKKVDDTQSAKENMWVPQIMTVFFHVSSYIRWSMTTQILMFGGFVYGFTTYPTKSCQHLAGSQQSTNKSI